MSAHQRVTTIPTHRQVVLGEVGSVIENWLYSKSLGARDPEAALDVLALWSHLGRFPPGEDDTSERRLDDLVHGDAELLAATYLAGEGLGDWCERVAELPAILGAPEGVVAGEQPETYVRTLFDELDRHSLAVYAANKLVAVGSPLANELQARRRKIDTAEIALAEDPIAFLAAAPLARRALRDFRGDLFAADVDLWRSTAKHHIVEREAALAEFAVGLEPLNLPQVHAWLSEAAGKHDTVRGPRAIPDQRGARQSRVWAVAWAAAAVALIGVAGALWFSVQPTSYESLIASIGRELDGARLERGPGSYPRSVSSAHATLSPPRTKPDRGPSIWPVAGIAEGEVAFRFEAFGDGDGKFLISVTDEDGHVERSQSLSGQPDRPLSYVWPRQLAPGSYRWFVSRSDAAIDEDPLYGPEFTVIDRSAVDAILRDARASTEEEDAERFLEAAMLLDRHALTREQLSILESPPVLDRAASEIVARLRARALARQGSEAGWQALGNDGFSWR
ncbi:MAG: hypothetical protein AAF628_20335 [Planctomycetota bacterium]